MQKIATIGMTGSWLSLRGRGGGGWVLGFDVADFDGSGC